MRQTEKYRKACEILTFPHSTQDQLYSELNRLGFFWNSKQKSWDRDDRLAQPLSGIFRIRVLCDSNKVKDFAAIVSEAIEGYGFNLVETSQPYLCRPPKQNEARIYLSFLQQEDRD